ncbi:DivIVA domain-containing protein [Microbacterium sp. SLBN-154]|uniref:DivIVA domain-containing protein n=1 Tax=Microbacterium sp. SLBN-154 TaxID=2768458 RepID=UPI00115122AC|nr:DivIVA domain-containing protein [Microbacterium sp. SLBN-154]TQK19763.1 DivIVA domain-containing protein [Microbacterium sp. SLBN-154]
MTDLRPSDTGVAGQAHARAAFPITRGREKGYDRSAVDDFLLRARESFEGRTADPVTSWDVRHAAFALVRGGYVIDAVDSALGRIEDAFAAREREAEVARLGAAGWVGRTRDLAQEVLDRLSRPEGRRFDRVGVLGFGYRVDEVDLVADRICRYLESGQTVTVEQVRAVAFRMQRGGYREQQVDAVLDAVVEVMLAVS